MPTLMVIWVRIPAREKGEVGKKGKKEEGRTNVTGNGGRSDAAQIKRDKHGSDTAS
jgi:hypothetical protein